MALVMVIGMSIAPAAAVGGDVVANQDAETPEEVEETDEQEDEQEETNESDEETEEGDVNMSPGEQFSAAVGSKQSDIESDVRERAFGISIAQDNAPDHAAVHIGSHLEDAEERLEDLEAQKEEIEQQYEEGEITEGQYNARMAMLDREVNGVEASIESAEGASENVSDEVLEENGVNMENVQTLKESASEMTGPEVAAIAQEIAGNTPDHAGPPEHAGGNDDADADDDDRSGPPEHAGGNDDADAVDETEDETGDTEEETVSEEEETVEETDDGNDADETDSTDEEDGDEEQDSDEDDDSEE